MIDIAYNLLATQGHSKEHFTDRENEVYDLKKVPEDVNFQDDAW